MAIIIGGHETGLLDSSLALLNRNDRTHGNDPGHGEQLYVNVSNGNLSLQQRDAFIPSRGDDYLLVRTYNARGRASDAHQHEDARWTLSTTVRLTVRHDSDGQFFEVEYGDGSFFDYHLDAATGLYVSTDGAGAYETIEDLGVTGNTEPAYILTRADQTKLTFDKQGHLLSSIDTNGVRMDFVYESDRLVQVIDDQGHVLNYVYLNGVLFQVVDESEGVLVEYHYDSGRLSEVIDRDGHSTKYFYTNDGFLERIVLPSEQMVDGVLETYDSREINFQYDTVNWRGNNKATAKVLTQITDAEGGVTSFEYDFNLTTPGQDTGLGHTISNGKGHFKHGDLTTEVTTDDKFYAGGTTKVIDALGNNRAYSNAVEYIEWRTANGYYATYDAVQAAADPNYQAQVDAIRNAYSLTYTFDGDGYITDVIDQQGFNTTYEYDELNNLTAVTDRNGWGAINSDSAYYRALRAELGYVDAVGNGKLVIDLTEVEKAELLEAFTSHFTYDERGNLLSSTDNTDNVVSFSYTSFNKIASSTSAVGHALVTSDEQQYQDKRIELGYAALVADLSVADVQAILDLHSTYFVYDANQNLIERRDSGGDITRFDYDIYGNQTQRVVYLDASDLVDPAKQQVTQFIYDIFGNNIETIDGEGNRTYSEYDHFGNLLRFTDGNGGITLFTYDDDHRLLTVTDPEGHITINTYDAVGNRISVTDANGHTITRIYDRNNNLISTLDPSDTDSLKNRLTQFEYDVVGSRTATVDAEGRRSEFRFNARRELVEVKSAEVVGDDGVTLTQYSSTFAYDGEGNRIRSTNNRGFTTDVYYTQNNLIREQRDANGHVTRFVYDANNNQVQIIAGVQLAENKRQVLHFSFDEEDQLIRQTDAEGNITQFAYDAPGNRVAVTDGNGNITNFEYDHNNRLIREIRAEVIDPTTGLPTRYNVEHRYDANGNEIETIDENGHSTRFTFDKDDRLVMVEDANTIKTVFEYDSRHNRTSVQIGVDASVDVNGNIVIAGVTDAQVTRFIYDEFNQLVAQVDGMGNALAQSDAPLYQTMRQELGYAALVANLSDTDKAALRQLYTTRFDYDRVGNQLSSEDNLGRPTHFEYDTLNRLVTRTDALGQTTRFRYDGNGNRVTQVDALGRETTFSYDSVDRLTDSTDPLGVVTHRDYNDFGNLTTETRAFGTTEARSTTFEYDLNNRVIHQTDPLGHSQSFDYDAVGNRIRVTDARLNATEFIYDALNRNIKIIDPLSFETRFEYDGVGNQLAFIDARGGVTRFDYDPGNRRIAATDAEGRVTTFAYDVRSNRIEQRTAAGTADEEITVFEYDAENNLRSVLDAEGHVTSNDYDRVYNRIATTDANGNTTYTEFDAVDQVFRVTDAEGGVTSFDYDAVGNRLTQVDALGRPTSFVYDANDRLIIQTTADGVETHFSYDKVGNRTAITRAANTPDAATDTFSYNLDDQLIAQSDALGNTTTFEYDENHNRTFVTDANGNTTEYRYDANNRVIEIIDPELNTVHYLYDGNGNRIQVIDGRGFATTTYYNANNEVALGVDAEGYATSFVYDNNGNVVSQTLHMQALTLPVDPTLQPLPPSSVDDQTTAFEYDKLNRVTARNDAEGYRTEFVYDAVGNRLQTRQYRDLPGTDIAVTHSYYDALNRETASVSAEGYLVEFVYNAVGNQVQRTVYDERVSIPSVGVPQPVLGDPGRVEHFVFDLVSRLVRETSPLGVHTDFEYDARGNRTAIVEAAGTGEQRRTVYGYDQADRLTDTTDALGTVTHLELDGNGNVTTRHDAFGTLDARTTSYLYDGNNRALQETDALGTITTMDYDANGNVTTITRAVGLAEQRSESFEYDGNNRRTAEVNGELERTESSYDGAGNRISLTVAPGLAEQRSNLFEFDKDNRLVASIDGEGVRTEYVYDGAGNKRETIQAVGIIGEERHSIYDYDLDNRLIRVTDPMNFVTEYEYDVLGNQIQITDAKGGIQHNTFDALGRHISSLSAGNILTVNQYDLRGNVIQTTQSFGDGSDARTTYYEFDLLDRQVLVTDAEDFSTRIDYDVFGNQVAITHGLYLLQATDPGYDAAKAAQAFVQNNAFSYDAENRMLSLTDGEGNVATYAYDAHGNRTSLTEAANSAARTTTYRFDKADRLIETVTPEGGITRNSYDEAGNKIAEDILQSVDGMGVETWIHRGFEYDANTRLTATIDPYGVRDEFEYDAMGNQIFAHRAAGSLDVRTTAKEFDLNNRLVADIDGEGHRTVYEYDKMGNRSKITDAENRVARYYFDAANQLIAVLDAEGFVNTFQYDSAGNRTEEYIYFTPYSGPVDDVIPPAATPSVKDRISTTSFDGNNRALSRTESDGTRTDYTYDAVGNLKLERQFANTAAPRDLVYEYDLNNRLRFFTDVDGTITEFEYDGANNKTLERISNASDPNAVRETAFQYDLNNRQTKTIYDPNGALNYVQEKVYDKLGNVVSSIDARGLAATLEYDLNNRIVAQTDAENNKITFDYDKVGNQIAVTDALGFVTEFVYDNNDRLRFEIQPEVEIYNIGQTVPTRVKPTIEHIYDAVGNEVQVIDPGTDNVTQRYVTSRYFDSNNRVIAEINGDNVLKTFDYNAAGEQVTETLYMERLPAGAHDPNIPPTPPSGESRTIVRDYDLAGRLLTATYPAIEVTELSATETNEPIATTITKQPTEVIVYDVFGNAIETFDTNENRTVSYYDAKNRLLAQVDAEGYLIEWEYDAQDNVLEQYTYANPLDTLTLDPAVRPVPPLGDVYQVSRRYDVANRLIEEYSPLVDVYDANNPLLPPSTERILTTYTYDANNNQTSKTLAAGTADARTEYYYYDANNRQVAIINALRVLHLFQYDANGNQTLQKRFFNPVDQGIDLTSLDGATTDFTTLVTGHVDDQSKVLSYNEHNRVTTETDLMGMGTSDDLSKRNEYNARGERTRTTNEDGYITQFSYNALSRVVTTINADGNGTIAEYDAAGNQTRVFTGQLFDITSGEPTSYAVAVDTQTLTANFGQTLDIGWQLPAGASVETYVVYGTTSVPSAGIPESPLLGYAQISTVQGTWFSTDASVALDLSQIGGASGTEIYFRVVSRDIAGNLAWTEEQSMTLPPRFTDVAVEQTAPDSLAFSVVFEGGPVAPLIRYGVSGSLTSSAVLVDQGGGVFSAALAGLTNPQELAYRIEWQDVGGNIYQSEEVPFEAQGEHTGIVSNISETSVVSGSETRYKINLDVQVPPDMVDRFLNITGEWRLAGSDVSLGSVSVQDDPDPANRDGLYTLVLASNNPLAAGDYQITLRGALAEEDINLDIFTVSVGGGTLPSVRQSASWDGVDVGDSRLVIVGGISTPSVSEAGDNRLIVATSLLDGTSSDYSVFYGTASTVEHSTSVTSTEITDPITSVVLGYDLGVSTTLDSSEAARVDVGGVRLAWRPAGSGIAFANDVALSASGTTYSTTLPLLAAGQYDLKIYYTDTGGNEVIVDWLRADTATASSTTNGFSLTVLARETDGTLQRSGSVLLVDPGLYTGPVSNAGLTPLALAITGTGEPGGTRNTNGEETGYFTENTYNALNVLIGTNAETGIWREFDVDANGNRLAIREFGLDAQTGQPIKTGNPLRTSYTAYDKRNRYVAEFSEKVEVTGPTDVHRAVRRFQYDVNDNITYELDAREAVTLKDYDALGSLLKVTDHYSAVTEYHYDRFGNELRVIDQLNHTRDKFYDIGGRLIREVDGEGHGVDYFYDSFDRRQTMVNAKGDTMEMKYDQRDRLIQTTAKSVLRSAAVDAVAEDLITQYQYDGRNNRTLTTDANGHTVQQVYDVLGRVVDTITFQDGNAVHEKRQYDAYGNLVAEIDGAGRIKSSVYSGFGRLLASFDTGNRRNDFTYDALGNLIAEARDASGKNVTSTYDALGRVKSITDHTTGVSTVYTYNLAGDRTTEVITTPGNAHDRNYTIEYDALGQHVSWADSVTGLKLNYLWDSAGNLKQVYTDPGDNPNVVNDINFVPLLDQAEADIRSIMVDDGYGQVPKYTGSQNQVLRAYAIDQGVDVSRYDQSFDLQTVDDGYSTYQEWSLNVTQRPNVLADLLSDIGYATEVQALFDAAYDPTFQFVDHFYSYDNNNRVISVTQNDIAWREYEYDSAGNRIAYRDGFDENGLNPVILNYEFNSLGWLLKGTTSGNSGSSDWTYDKVGNIKTFLNVDGSGETTSNISYDYWENNIQYKSVDHKEGQTTTNVYDLGGRQTSLSVESDGNTSTFTYNYFADGRVNTIDGRGKSSSGRTVYTYNANDKATTINAGQGDEMARPQIQHLVYNNKEQILFQYNDNGKSGDIPTETAFVMLNDNPVGETGTNTSGKTQTQLDVGRYNLVQKYGEDFPTGSLTSYSVRSGDTLQGIASIFYGNPSLWFVIAEANGLDPSQPLKEGQKLQIPNTAKTGELTAKTHTVYDEGEIIGSTLPNLKTESSGGGCSNIIAIIIVVVIAVVAIYLTAGLAASFIGPAGGFLGLTSTAATIAAYAVAGAIVGAVASIVQQGLFIALGFQDEFSWKSVAAGAISGAFSGAAQGVGAAAKAAELAGTSFKYARVAASALKVASAASKQLIENGKITSWTSLATAALAPVKDTQGEVLIDGLVTDTQLDYVTPWLQLAETAIRNDGDLEPLDWANAVGSTLTTAFTPEGGAGDSIFGSLNSLDRRIITNLAVGGALSAFDSDGARSYLENAIGNEIGQLIGQSIVTNTGLAKAVQTAEAGVIETLAKQMRVRVDSQLAESATPQNVSLQHVELVTNIGTSSDPEKLVAPNESEQVNAQQAIAQQEVTVLNGQDQSQITSTLDSAASQSGPKSIAELEQELLEQYSGEVNSLKNASLDELEKNRDGALVITQKDIDKLRASIDSGHELVLLSGQLRQVAEAEGYTFKEFQPLGERGPAIPVLTNEDASFLLEQLDGAFSFEYPEGTQGRIFYIPDDVSSDAAKKAIIFDIGRRADDGQVALLTNAVDQVVGDGGGKFIDGTIAYNQSLIRTIERRLDLTFTDEVANFTNQNLSSFTFGDVVRDPVAAAGAFLIDLATQTIDSITRDTIFVNDDFAPAMLREDATTNLILEGALLATGGIGKATQGAVKAFQAARRISGGIRSGALSLRSPIFFKSSFGTLNSGVDVTRIGLRNPLVARLNPNFRFGANGRLESAFAKIEPQHIGTGTATNEASRLFARALGRASDDAGHAIGKNLGGLGGKNSGNIFPQTPGINRGAFNQFEQQVAREVQAGKEVFVRVLPKYESSIATRPGNIIYQLRIDGKTIVRTFENP